MEDTTRTMFTKYNLNGGVVLVVEDDLFVGKFIKTVIEREGVECILVETGEEALTAFENMKVSAIISDVVLTGMSGIALARAVHDINKNVPIMFCTGVSDPSTLNLLWQHGLVYNKPIEEDFPAALRRLIMCASNNLSEYCGKCQEEMHNRRKDDV